ncbi:hypothetical protein EDC04DRAFT_2630036 [Pisolithus marmoratus]|nr:hypothetical protein EDC04DRAFT_2630036 [Pisolithus marmoratus]
MSAPPVMTFPAQCYGFAPRSGPLGSPPDTVEAYILAVQYPLDMCRSSYGLRRLPIYGNSQLVHYLPSRRNRQCSGIPTDQQKMLKSNMVESLNQFCILVVVLLVLRVVADTALYICRPPSHSEYMHYRTVPPACKSSEPTPTTAAVSQFVSNHIKLASSMAALSTSFDVRFHELLEDQATLKGIQWASLVTERSHLSYSREMTEVPGVNVTELLHTPLIDFAPGGFIGRTLTYALDELGRLSIPSCPDYSYTRGEDHDIRALAVYHRISSSLLLEYSAAQPRIKRLLDDLRITHQRLTWMVSQRDDERQIYELRRCWWHRNDCACATKQEAFSGLFTRLDAMIESLSLLSASLDLITEELSCAPENPESDRKIELPACLDVLRSFFARSVLSRDIHLPYRRLLVILRPSP